MALCEVKFHEVKLVCMYIILEIISIHITGDTQVQYASCDYTGARKNR